MKWLPMNGYDGQAGYELVILPEITTESEIENTPRKVKNNKAPGGTDGVLVEMIKHGESASISFTMKLFDRYKKQKI